MNITSKISEDKFLQLKKQFTHWMELQGWTKRTICTYAHNVQHLIEFLIKTNNHYSFTDQLYQYQHHLHQRKTANGRSMAITTVHTNLVAIRSFLKFLHESLDINIDAKSLIRLPVKPKPIPKHVLSETEVLKLLSIPRISEPLGIRNKAIMELLYASGIRNTELRELAVQDIDFEQLRIIIRKGKYQKDRVIPIGEVAIYWLYRYLNECRLNLFSHSSGNTMFLSKCGNKITRGNLNWLVTTAASKAGLPGRVTPHALRHTCATHMLKNGADIRYIQEHLGHASVATTQIYTRVMITDLHRVFLQTHPRATFK